MSDLADDLRRMAMAFRDYPNEPYKLSAKVSEDVALRCERAADEIERLRRELDLVRAGGEKLLRQAEARVKELETESEKLREAGVGYSQQTVDALSKERDGYAAEATRYADSLKYIGGIVERGEGRKIAEDEPIQDAIREYVKRLESR